MAKNEINFTVKELDSLNEVGAYYDTNKSANGLYLRIKNKDGAKAFKVFGRVNGKQIEVSLGTYPKVTIQQARQKARDAQTDFANDINPNIKKKLDRTKQTTLEDMFQRYLEVRKLKPKTVAGYQTSLKNVLSPLASIPISEIDYNKVLKVHKAYAQRSQAEADRAMRLLKAIINMGMDEIRDIDGRPIILENPVEKLGKNRHMKKLDRKVNKLEDNQLKPFIDTMEAMSSDSRPFFQTGADLALMLFYHGTRFGEMARMKWQQVDFSNKRFYLDETKNGRRLWLPMNSESETVLKRRKKLSTGGEFVFASVKDNEKPLSDIKKPLRELLELTGIKITPHDLRRTFLGMGARLKFNDSILKQLANHATGSDVTTGYLIQSADELKEPSQRIANRFLELAGRSVTDSDSQLKELLSTLSEPERRRLLMLIQNQGEAV